VPRPRPVALALALLRPVLGRLVHLVVCQLQQILARVLLSLWSPREINSVIITCEFVTWRNEYPEVGRNKVNVQTRSNESAQG
jgi:hypothetical protein